MNSGSMNSKVVMKTTTSKVINDPIGKAILDYSKTGISREIIVSSDICDDDVIPSAYLFRDYNAMPSSEQIALQKASGKILDVGAAAGAHARYLKDQGKEVHCIDISPGSVEYLQSQGFDARQKSFLELTNEKYDTILLLMNGIGIAGDLERLDDFLIHAKSLLTEGGTILCDSTDIKYLYEDDEGGFWVDLNSSYYGNFNFQMTFGDSEGNWFPWLYVDYETLEEHAELSGLRISKLFEEESHYLAEINI